MNKLYDVFDRREIKSTILGLLTNPDKNCLVHVAPSLLSRVNPFTDGFAINTGRMPCWRKEPLNSFIEDPRNNLYYEIREKTKGPIAQMFREVFHFPKEKIFTLTEVPGSCQCSATQFDKYVNIYLYHGTLDEMITEIREAFNS